VIEVALMIEGQNGLTWDRWQAIATRVEELGFAGLYRSDHYTNANPPDKASLECWTSLTWLASHTRRIEFGPLVSPLSFRHPTMLARMAAAVDDLSAGRLVLGLGAGWQEREHHNYGLPLLALSDRFDRFAEGLAVIEGLLKKDTPFDYQGKYYQIQEGLLLPRPVRPGGPSILIGGNGPLRTLPLVARFGDEWNAFYLQIAQYRQLSQTMDQYLTTVGRLPSEVRRSLMTGCVFGYDQADLERKVSARTAGKKSPGQMSARDLLVGTPHQLVHILGRWAEAGVQRVMLQWLDLDDLDGLEGFAHKVLPQLA
jgi:F420-dependent oxidoreductase-like protein